MVDMAAAREAFPESVVVAANLDPVSELRFGRPGPIRDKVAACRELAGPRFMVCAGCEIPSGTPLENLEALCEPLT